MKNENGNLLTTYVVECFDEENALCQIKTNVSVKLSVVSYYLSIMITWGCKNLTWYAKLVMKDCN